MPSRQVMPAPSGPSATPRPLQAKLVGGGVTVFTTDGVNWKIRCSAPALVGMTLNSVSVTDGQQCQAGAPPSNSVWIDALQPGGATDTNGVVAGVESAESLDNGALWLESQTGGGTLIAAFDANTAWQTLPYTAVQYDGECRERWIWYHDGWKQCVAIRNCWLSHFTNMSLHSVSDAQRY